MRAIATPTAAAAARKGSRIARAALTPTPAAIRLPPTIDHGWASGLDGTAKSRTADAPIGAIRTGRLLPLPTAHFETKPVTRMPSKAPAAERRRSVTLTGVVRGIQDFRAVNMCVSAFVQQDDPTGRPQRHD